MNREQLEHAIRAACDVADDHELYVFGRIEALKEIGEDERQRLSRWVRRTTTDLLDPDER